MGDDVYFEYDRALEKHKRLMRQSSNKAQRDGGEKQDMREYRKRSYNKL